jgi:hypothetical protein
LKWLERDFEPNTRPEMPQEYRLLILDGHNSHCTYPFIKFAAEHRIIIICLPSHTTHALQPCDVGVFGPLAHAWKSQVTQASQNNIAITKDNLLLYYHKARTIALKSTTIKSAFRKTGIYPFDRNAIPLSAFEPAKNTTTQAAQPLPAQLPSILVPTPDPSPETSAAATRTPDATPDATPATSAAPSSLSLDLDVDPNGADTTPPAADGAGAAEEPKTTQRYHIEVPPPVLHSASRRALREENAMLRDIITRVAMVLEQDYAQMKLMDLENERLRQKAFGKDQRKARKKLASGQARHMTAPEMMDLLARQTWETVMGDVFKEASERFKVQRKMIDDYHKGIAAEKKAAEKARKAAARQAKKAETDAERARVQAERGRGRGGRGRGRGGRGGHGRGTGRDRDGTRATNQGFDNDSEGDSESDSTLTDYEDIPAVETATTQPEHRLPRACRARAPRFFANDDEEEDVVPEVVRPRPKPRPIRKQQVPAPQAPSFNHDTNIQLPEDTGTPQECETHVGGEIALVGTEEQVAETLTHPDIPSQTLASKDRLAATQSGRTHSRDVEVYPSRSVLGGEPVVEPAGDENGAESGLPVRRSRRLATKGK